MLLNFVIRNRIAFPVLKKLTGLSIATLLIVLVPTMTGCGGSADKTKIQQASRLVEECLNVWAEGKGAESLALLSPPIRFFDDDWNRSAKLIEYQIEQTFVERADETVRVVVRLKVRGTDGKESEVRCAYQVVVDPEIVIARDPMS